MFTRTHNRSLARRLVLPAFAAAYLGYFGFHAFSGSYGIRAKAAFDDQAVILEAELAELRAETAVYERRSSLLRREGLDPDMIDERARQSLNVIGPRDVVIIP